MGSEVKSKKRKIMPDDEVAKSKKIKQTTSDAVPKKRKAATETDPGITKKSKALKPADDENSTSKATTNITGAKEVKKGKSTTKEKPKPSQDATTTKKQVKPLKDGLETKDKQSKLHKVQGQKHDEGVLVSDNKDESITGGSDEDEVDDQTEALLKGFESEDDEEKDPQDKGYEAGQKIPELDKKTKKAAREAATSDSPGVIYVGRIPHGFYEQEMKQYFSQFGDISNLRLSRNRKTGRSKHFAFIEFKSGEVAEIVSKTMDNYLLFGHILKCKLVAPEQVHPNLWKGANKRFKKVPWNKMEGRKLNQGMTEEAWNKRVVKEEERRAKKKEALKLIGYEFESPKVKSAEGVAKKMQQSLIVATEDDVNPEGRKAIEAPQPDDEHLPVEEAPESAKSKKSKKKMLSQGDAVQTVLNDTSNTQDIPAVEETPNRQEKNEKKNKKSTVQQEGAFHAVQSASEKVVGVPDGEKGTKVKKSKKGKAL